MSMIFDIIKSRGVRRLSAVNRFLSSMNAKSADVKLSELHGSLDDILKEQSRDWPFYDYGEGFFYQSYPGLCVYGLRNTDLRFKIYRLDSILLSDMNVLDIGCNSGFLSLAVAKRCAHVDALDNNPFLIRIAEMCRQFENQNNVKFFCRKFDEFKTSLKYDIVLSLANHNTFDGNMRPEFRKYMETVRTMLKKGGLLIFESHPGEHRKPFLKKQIDSIQDIFIIKSTEVISTKKSIYDTDRIVAWLEAK